ncbi:DUF4982 domain-containing protein [Mucilaginibacter sp. RS28]|uniref:DUF4982 domain-containing protein n=1 Tax=Mucilaginibacter straminoryzae TaxID=2932774 RepID=A0A9X1X2Y1_9SPHI|nr:glycoside hydrolase family 2 TIM barrel-domain containing protein [Mucilaginibacter straminoryzae]MCJ8210023.1 DUF4982 domain-containing protein [Mucilaginibacter straminoryzae]
MRFPKFNISILLVLLLVVAFYGHDAMAQRITQNFDRDWKFFLGDDSLARNQQYNDVHWRKLELPHDWSIEGQFSDKNNTTQAEGGLPAGIGWYRKTFTVPAAYKGKDVTITFDGVYRNSEVWINGHYLGKRPNGYITFKYDLSPYLDYGGDNVLAVKVDNSAQPNSRWYSGSGVYRHVWLTAKAKSHFVNWGTFITTPTVTAASATVHIKAQINSVESGLAVKVDIYNPIGKVVASVNIPVVGNVLDKSVTISKPQLWSVDKAALYKVDLQLVKAGKILDNETVNIGLRSFRFSADSGFFLNGKNIKIKGVCMHHDLGALGAAVNTRAMERQLQILQQMGCNAIRTSHNPPAPEFLDLCDRMGLLVMDEAFDMWRKKKSKHDYYKDFPEWHEKDLTDQVLRDRNHPSIIMWSIGNEIREQFDSTGISITKELVNIVKRADPTRPVTSALSEANPDKNFIYKSGALDVIGLNYHQEVYADFQKNYPGKAFIGSETMSALETRGYYDQPADTTRHWPQSAKKPLTEGNAELAVSAYDNVAAYWGSTHEETWKIIKKYPFLSGLFIWTGFDYIGEPTPYPWPARSSYFGIVDLAGFPKDVYYMYQSEWTDKPVLHLLPHWNWKQGQAIDVWAYYNQADEVELYLNGRSLGIRKKTGDDLHVNWKVPFEAGTLKAVSRQAGKVVKTAEVKTAGKPEKLVLSADRLFIKADGKDLSFITVKVLDAAGNVVPDANDMITFSLTGKGKIAGLDNGAQASLESFKGNKHSVFHGLGLAIIQAGDQAGTLTLKATAPGLKPALITIRQN